MCLVQYFQIHLNSLISGFTFVFTLVIELYFLNDPEAIFFDFAQNHEVNSILFSDIGLHFEVVEYSSPIKRNNGNQRSKSTKAQIH